MLKNLVTDYVCLYDVEDDDGIIHNLVFLVDEILGSFLHAVNDSLEREAFVDNSV